MEKFLIRALRLIESDHRNLKKVTDTGVGTGDKEESRGRHWRQGGVLGQNSLL